MPGDPAEARDWLLRHDALIRAGLLACAADFDTRPDDPGPRICIEWSWDRFPEPLPGVRMTLYVLKNREFCPLPLASFAREVAAHWSPRLEALEANDPPPYGPLT